MNKFLFHKNEECIKQNSADFYTLSIYSKDILRLDDIRLKEFSDFYKCSNQANSQSKYFQNVVSNKYKIISGIIISSVLMYRFKSILIVPLFFSGYLVMKRIILNLTLKHECEDMCYFCQKNIIKKEKIDKYEKYYKVINYIFDKNQNISSLDDFEKELEKSINEYKI
jgi:hypothetical protein